jgi:uncharacterized protein (DUF2252 family)
MEPFNANADGSFPPARPRPAWVKDRIRLFNRKLEPRFREKKLQLMAQSPFAFYRGTGHLFWEDLGKSELVDRFGGGKGTRIWISGDLHADNFGSFRDAAGRIVYDLNDFDESLLADHQYDLWRLGVSLVLLGREAKKGPKAIPAIVENMARGYWRELKSCRWYDNIRYSPWDEEQASGELRHFLGHARKNLGYEHMLKRWTQVDKDGLHFKLTGNPDLEALPKDAAQRLRKALNRYAEELKPWPVEKPNLFEILDLARRLNAGIGSEGHLRYYALLRVRDNGPDSYRILDIKQGIEPSACGWKRPPRPSAAIPTPGWAACSWAERISWCGSGPPSRGSCRRTNWMRGRPSNWAPSWPGPTAGPATPSPRRPSITSRKIRRPSAR